MKNAQNERPVSHFLFSVSCFTFLPGRSSRILSIPHKLSAIVVQDALIEGGL